MIKLFKIFFIIKTKNIVNYIKFQINNYNFYLQICNQHL